MDQVGPANKPIDRILLFREGKDPVVFAEKLNAIFGMVWHDGALYVMNMPHLTVFRDRDGDGRADERKELFKDLGVPAGSPNDFNDHIVSGLKIGIDGYLYISVGDKGVPKATGPRRPHGPGRGRRHAPLPARRHRAGGLLHRHPQPPRAQPRRPRQPLHLRQHRRRPGLVDPGHPPRRRRLLRLPVRLPQAAPTGCCRGWPSTAAARPAAACSTARTPGPRNTAAGSSGPSGASARCRRSGSSPTGQPSRSPTSSTSSSPATSRLPPARPGALARRQDHVRRRLVVGQLGQQDREARAGLRGDVRRIRRAKTRPRGKDSDPIDAQIKQLDHPSYHERRRAQTALIGQGKAALGRPSPPWRTRRPTRSRSGTWSGSSTRSPAARPRRAGRSSMRCSRPSPTSAPRPPARWASAPCRSPMRRSSPCSRIPSPRSGSRP